jgi:hypothetical protein
MDAVSASPHPDEPHILNYLDQGVCAAGCGGVVPDALDPSLPVRLGLDILTDGVWEWPQYLSYYIKRYHISLPDEFIEHMRINDWIVPNVSVLPLAKKVVYL